MTNEREKKVFAVWALDKALRRKSTSGGAFTALAETIIKQGGCVFGAAFDDDFVVRHVCVRSVDDLYMLRGSKYVQSKIGDSFIQVKKCLSRGETVLFSGTPCQIAGLKSFLGDFVSGKLYTIDLVCHGVPSPLVFDQYKKYIERKYHSRIKSIQFRSKKYSWWSFGMRIGFVNGKYYYERSTHDPYLRAFLREFDLRPSCHCCHFNNLDRPSDITLSDFWFYKETNPMDYDTDEGISMVMINSLKGYELFNTISGVRIVEKTLDEAIRTNKSLREPYPPNPQRDDFWGAFLKKGFEGVIDEYLYHEKSDRGKYTIYINAHFHNLPGLIKKGIKAYYCLFDKRFCRDRRQK